MSHATNKRERMERVEQLLLSSRRGVTVAEIAADLECDISTVYRYLIEIEMRYPIITAGRNHYRLDPSRYISHISLRPEESLSLYLALRRDIRQTTDAPLFMINALQKVSGALYQDELADQIRDDSALLKVMKTASSSQSEVWATIIRGWLERITVRIEYLKASSQDCVVHEIEPYLFEPAILSHGTYLIAFSITRNDLRTFKMHRIKKAWLTTASFTPRYELNPNELLNHAWGIWYGSAPTRIELRFSPRVAWRVQETKNHPSERIETQSDGGLLWSVEITGVQELIPWIRGWGADVEVLAPESLRAQITLDIEKAAELYQKERGDE